MKNSLRGKDLSPYYVEPDQPCRGRKEGEYKKRRYVGSLQNRENWKLTIVVSRWSLCMNNCWKSLRGIYIIRCMKAKVLDFKKWDDCSSQPSISLFGCCPAMVTSSPPPLLFPPWTPLPSSSPRHPRPVSWKWSEIARKLVKSLH